VALVILPIFAIVNTCIPLHGEWYLRLFQPNSSGIFFGLIVGKPVGIISFCLLAILFKLGRMPDGLRPSHLVGAGILAGIGFTMSIFISTLAFDDHDLGNMAQISVLLASATAAVLGGFWFIAFVPDAPVGDVD
jgi:NhaA family Na+:H+ antiporter